MAASLAFIEPAVPSIWLHPVALLELIVGVLEELVECRRGFVGQFREDERIELTGQRWFCCDALLSNTTACSMPVLALLTSRCNSAGISPAGRTKSTLPDPCALATSTKTSHA
jgi:hypothetical protein